MNNRSETDKVGEGILRSLEDCGRLEHSDHLIMSRAVEVSGEKISTGYSADDKI